jgi:hypothetical protein
MAFLETFKWSGTCPPLGRAAFATATPDAP